MDEKAKELRDAIKRATQKSAQDFPLLPTLLPAELVSQVVAYVREQARQGISIRQCSQDLEVSEVRLQDWLDDRRRRFRDFQKRIPLRKPPAVWPMEVSLNRVPIYDGVREDRYTVRSPAGWEASHLTLKELTELLRRFGGSS